MTILYIQEEILTIMEIWTLKTPMIRKVDWVPTKLIN